jgi:hypothetical protein
MGLPVPVPPYAWMVPDWTGVGGMTIFPWDPVFM